MWTTVKWHVFLAHVSAAGSGRRKFATDDTRLKTFEYALHQLLQLIEPSLPLLEHTAGAQK